VIYFDVDHLGSWLTGSFMESPTLIGVRLSDVRVVMMIMHVLVVELLYQAVMEQIPVLECLLPGMHGYQRLRHVMSDTKWPHFLRISTPRSPARYWEPLGMATEGPGACRAGSQGGARVG
jgi:hypothetical protein